MKVLEVKKIVSDKEYPDLEKVSEMLDRSASRHRIDTVNWKNFSYKPDEIGRASWRETV